MVNKAEIYVRPKVAIAALLLSVAVPLTVGVVAGAIGSTYESSCTARNGEQPICTTHYQYGKGGDIPLPSLQAIAAALGVGFGIYAGLKNGRIPNQLKVFLGGEDDASSADTEA